MTKKKNTEIELYPWEQQPGESAKKYAAFQTYLMMGKDGEDRSLRKVAQELNKSLTHIGTLSSENNWVERVEAWDREQLRLKQKKYEAELAKMRDTHAKGGHLLFVKAMKRAAKINFDELSPQDTRYWMETGMKIERLSRGDTSEVIEERNGGSALDPVQIYLPDNGRDGSEDEE